MLKDWSYSDSSDPIADENPEEEPEFTDVIINFFFIYCFMFVHIFNNIYFTYP